MNNSSLFLSQSYQDAWADYTRSLTQPSFRCWDYIILTASDEQQAEGFRAQLKARRDVLPSRTHIAVISDEGGVRVGSGGATLSVIRYIVQHTGKTTFDGLRILVIHSGGDSKRVPQYSALGKLFSPVPHELPDGRSSTLFDEFIIAMSSVPSRIKEGMLILSGDVLLLFNPLLIDYSGSGAAAISIKENVETGKNHGVFLRGADGNVQRFLHKQTVETLRSCGAINAQNCVDIDTGAVIFSCEMLQALYSLVATDELYKQYVNETVRLSLYADFLYPLATDSTLEQFYREKPEGVFCDALKEARTTVWNLLRPFRMKLLRMAPAKFIHFGTTKEILELMSDGIDTYKNLGWNRHINSSIVGNTAGYNSVLSREAEVGDNCYLEVSYVHPEARIGDNVVLSYIDIYNETIPSNVVLHGLKQKDGKFIVRIFGILDNPKTCLEDGCSFLGSTLAAFMERNGIRENELWSSAVHGLWDAALYPVCETIEEATQAALNLYAMVQGVGDVARWRKAIRKSLQTGFRDADPDAIIAWDKRMQELVSMERVDNLIAAGESVYKVQRILAAGPLTKIQQAWLQEKLCSANYSEKMRLHYYIGKSLGGVYGEKQLGECFKTIQQAILENTMKDLRFNESCKIIKDKHTVKLPLRVNWGGGWSDTPPYCNENGGTVLNAAILLNGEMPVEVTLRKIPEYRVIFDSRDMDVHGEFDTIEPLQATGDPYDPYALQKAALLACGILPKQGGDLQEILARFGGGFLMQTEVTNVPKGSGLGTSSILSAACVKAIFGFFGIPHTEDTLYGHVLCMEQIMSTGGGWQDQVGGLSNGIKYSTTKPGLKQEIHVQHLQIPEPTKQELNERFVLIYTGQRRLARNLLRDVVGRYIGNDPNALYALNEIQRIAALMRFELERGNIDAFAALLDEHWVLSQKIDAGSTNTLIDQIFDTISDLIDGRMICGAGGGGFLQVILKKGITKDAVHNRLKEVFQDSEIDAWDCTLV